ncbi:hypothetical protein [Pseudanabaena sp. BC1403]|nr:hypothetical protein [Pseudanabaena sp. BC1403]
MTAHVESQREKLEAENISIVDESGASLENPTSSVSLENYLWEEPTIYLR